MESRRLINEGLAQKCARLDGQLKQIASEHEAERKKLEAEIVEANNEVEVTKEAEVPHLQAVISKLVEENKELKV